MQKPWERYGRYGQQDDDPYTIQGPPREPTPQTGSQAQRDAAEAERARAEAQNAPQLAAAQAQKASAEAQLAQMQARAGNPSAQGDADQNGQRRALLDQLANQIKTVEGSYKTNYAQPGLMGKIYQSLPGGMSPTNQAFDSAASQMSNIAQGVTRIPGNGSQSDFEFGQFIKANQPSHGEFDTTIETQLAGMKDRVDSYRKSLGMEPADWSLVKPPSERMDATRPTVAGGDTPDQIGLSQRTRTVDDPFLKGISTKVGAMIARGVPDEKIRDFMQRQGVDPSGTSIGEALQFRRTPKFRQWQQQNPGKSYPVGKSFYQREVPLTGTQEAVNNLAQSAYGTGTVAAGQAITGNRLDDIAGALGGNAEQARMGEQILRAKHPYASLVGDLSGQAAMDLTLGRIPGLGHALETPWGRRAADLAYGAYSGSGENNPDGSGSGFTGAVSNAVGGALGRNVQRYGGKALKGVRDEGLQYLNDRGVPVTIGEISRSATNPLARAVGGIEDRVAGLPVAGDIINGARHRGAQGFNEAAFAEGGRPIGYAPNAGVVGPEAAQGLTNATGTAYSAALHGVTVKQDKAFNTQFTNAVSFGVKNPRHGADFQHLVDTEIAPLFGPGGEMTGENLQAAIKILREARASYRGQPLGAQMQKALTQTENAITGMVRRQAPRVMPALNAANEAYGNSRILSKATLAAKNREDNLFTPGQLNNASVANTQKYGGLNAAASTDRPFYRLGQAGQQYLSNVIPDSGTAGRYLIPGLITGAAGGAGAVGAGEGNRGQGALDGSAKGVALALALSAPYSKTGQRLIQKGLLGKRPGASFVEGLLKKHPELASLLNPNYFGGRVGNSLGRQIGLYDDQLDQP